jgi:GNAT superfamily N-acetyltransferase
MSQTLQILEADLTRPEHQRDVLALTEAYAMDPMGGGIPLPAETRERLIPGLQHHPTTMILLAYLGSTAVGMATCFRGFSTFTARPLLNIHDVIVLADYRGHGIARQLLNAAERRARDERCCKLTLEVGERNLRARQVYEGAGFAQAAYGTAGGLLFYSKTLE